MSNWKDSRNERRDIDRGIVWTGGRIVGVVIAVLVVAGLVGAATWGIGVVLSGPKGQGDGVVKNNSVENWTAAQARFEEYYADYEATIFKIEVAQTALEDAQAAGEPTKTLEQNLQGTINYCATLVGEYNAESRKFLSQDWKSVDLPSELSLESCSAPEKISLP